MHLCRTIALMLVCAAGAGNAVAQEFGWFAQLVGSCWKAVFPDGTTTHRQCYSRQFGKFIRGTAELKNRNEGKEVMQFQGDSLFAWDSSSASINYYIWGSDGSHRQLSAQYVNEELHFPVPSREDPTKIAVRSVWRRLSDTKFEVRRERPTAEGWNVDLRVTYERE